jgi:beta-mannosidase
MRAITICIAAIMISDTSVARDLSRRQEMKWELGYAATSVARPVKWIPATVPGAVQLDIAKAENYQPFYYAENWKDYLWMEDNFYTYRSTFKKQELAPGERFCFISKGIDYQFEIYLNSEKLFEQEGMFSYVSLDLTAKLKESNTLLIKVFPAPKLHARPADRSQASQSVKPAVSYGWDWHPRLLPLGIWDETYLEVQPSSFINDIYVNYQLNNELSKADISLEVSGRNLKGNRFQWSLLDKNGLVVSKAEGSIENDNFTSYVTFGNPTLWWPHDQGEPYLYSSVFQLINSAGEILQTSTSKIGFRRIKLVMNTGAWLEPSIFPKTRSVAPMQFEINSRRIFCKGTNWVNPEIFPGIINRDRYLKLLTLAKEANFNILRVWGGGIVNKEPFFDLCDEMGILVWQEFPLACNNYPDDPHYLKILKQESSSIINRVKKHPSHALWGGGNELFNVWSGMTDQSLALRLLNSQCLELDPATPFIPTSPVMGVGHGNYLFVDWPGKEEVFQEMARSKFTAYTEFGMPSAASVDLLKTIIPQEELWPPKPGTSWESHHAFNAWDGKGWLCQDIIEDYFGISGSLEVLVANSQLMQGEGYKCIYEEARRQKPYCSMATNWCYNEPWPTAANNNLVSYPNTPKPGFYAVKNACRPVLSSARFSKFKWREGEMFYADIWMLNDFYKDLPAGIVTIKIVADGSEISLLKWEYPEMKANINQSGPTVRFRLPAWKTDRFKIILEVEGHPEYNSDYILAYQPVTMVRR